MFETDYSKETQQVFVDMAAWHIGSYRDLDPLASCCAGGNDNLEGLPSWAEDWSLELPACFTLFNMHTKILSIYQACGAHKALAKDVLVESGLMVTGLLLDFVEETDEDYLYPDSSRAWRGRRELALKPVPQGPYGDSAGRLDALWRTLCTDKTDFDKRLPLDVGRDLEVFSQNLARQYGTGFGADSQRESDSFRDWLKMKGVNSHEFCSLFRTRRGYLGMSCKHVRAGDKVSILWGGHLPFLLREARTVELPSTPGLGSKTEIMEMVRHEVIGGYCYIHGLTDGQGLEVAEKEGIMPEQICLV